MFDIAVVATDGSASAERAVSVAVDVADRFDAGVHALYVLDTGDVAASPDDVRDDLERALSAAGERALAQARAAGDPARNVETAVREGDPTAEICRYAAEQEADLVVTGTRGRGGPGFTLGSVAKGVLRRAEPPVLTVRQLA